jgi:hypothetical protein
MVETIRKRVEKKLTTDDVKASLADYIRLVQLEKELEEDEPREIRVTWVDPKIDPKIEAKIDRAKESDGEK